MGITCYQNITKKPNQTGSKNQIPGKSGVNQTNPNEKQPIGKKKASSSAGIPSPKDGLSDGRKKNKKKETKGKWKSKGNSRDESESQYSENNSKLYSNLNKEKTYYLICPDCKDRYPFIGDIFYDEKQNDFIISYNCDCSNNKETKKSNMINFMNIKKPTIESTNFVSKEIVTKFKTLLEKYKNQFPGNQILKNIMENEFVTDRSMAPLPKSIFISNASLMYKTDVSKNESTNKKNQNFKDSYFKNSNLNELFNKESHLEISENYNLNDIDDNLFKSKMKKKYNQSRLHPINEDKEENTIKFECKKTIGGNNEQILSLIQLESGDIAIGSADNRILIWNISNSSLINEVQDNGKVTCLLEFEKNNLLSGNNMNEIYLWDIDSNRNKCISKFSGHQKCINSLVKCNYNYFASASDDGTIKIWNYEQKKEYREILAHKGPVLCIILLKSGNLCSGSEDKSIKIWNWNEGICIQSIDTEQNSIRSLYELEDETLLSGSNENVIQIWKDLKKIREIKGHDSQINSLLQINENYFVSCSDNIKIWELNNLHCCQILTDHDYNVTHIIKLKDNSLASCSEDRTIKIWSQC